VILAAAVEEHVVPFGDRLPIRLAAAALEVEGPTISRGLELGDDVARTHLRLLDVEQALPGSARCPAEAAAGSGFGWGKEFGEGRGVHLHSSVGVSWVVGGVQSRFTSRMRPTIATNALQSVAGEVAAACGATMANTSHHLKAMKDAGVVNVAPEGGTRRYSLIGGQVTANHTELTHESGVQVRIPLAEVAPKKGKK